MRKKMGATKVAGWLALLSTAVLSACKGREACSSMQYLDPVSGSCVVHCEFAGPEVPCWRDGGIVEAGIGRDAMADDARVDTSDLDAADVRDGADDVRSEATEQRCDGGGLFCGGECVDTRLDPRHCGACARACATSVANAHAACEMGACGFECDSGYERVGGTCEIAAPRPIAPMSGGTVTSAAPFFRWLPGRATDVRFTVCRDRQMRTNCTSVDLRNDGVGGVDPPLVAGSWFWQLTPIVGGVPTTRRSPVWQFRVGRQSSDVDSSWIRDADFNGDGIADLAVGSPLAERERGTVRIHNGLNSTISGTPTTLRGTREGQQFGTSLARVGDVNGDGFADLVVGSMHAARSDSLFAGSIALYLGGPSGLGPSPSIIVDGRAQEWLGRSIAGIDINRDGFSDIVAGGQERVSVFFGSPNGITATPVVIETPLLGDNFGHSVAAGDFNGDAYGDVAVGSMDATVRTSGGEGSVAVFLGSASGIRTPTRVLSAATAARFGDSIATGDFNADGLADIAVGSPTRFETGAPTPGAVSVFLGFARGVLGSPAVTLQGRRLGDAFGQSVASVPDANGDGRDELIVSAFEGNYASLYFGTADGVSATAATTIEGTTGNRLWSVSGLGDANNDGFGDIALGDQAADGAEMNSGAVFVLFGAASGINAMPALTFWGASAGDGLGELAR